VRTVRTLTEHCTSFLYDCGDWYQIFIYGCSSHLLQRSGGLRKKLAGRLKSKRPRADDADYTPTTDSEAQSSAGGSESMDTEDIPHTHPDYPIDITGWTFPNRKFSMAEYCSRRTVNQYTLLSDTNVQFLHTQLQFDVFWGTLMDSNFHKHQMIDWTFMLGQSVMEDPIPKFETCGLYQFMGQRTDFSEMAVKQFLAIAEIDIEEESITWITGFKRYSATFADFAAANSLNYDIISAGIDLYTEDNFEDFVQFYEPARLDIPRRFEETVGVRHHPAVINKIARVTILVTPRIFAVEFFLSLLAKIRALPFLFLFPLAKP
jgi:hypothetical protein